MPSEAEGRGRKLSTGAWRDRNGRQTAPRRHPAECEHTEPTDLVDGLCDGQRSRSAAAQSPCGPSISTGGWAPRSAGAWI
jgi:hypothetical protein